MYLLLAANTTFHSIDDNSKIGETYFPFFYRFSIISLVKFIHYHQEAIFVLVMNFPLANIKKERSPVWLQIFLNDTSITHFSP